MRCPHCAGEISEQSRFCGICGRSIDPPGSPSTGQGGGVAAAERGPDSVSGQGAHASAGPGARSASATPASPTGGSSLSLFELPVSRGARIARVAAILALDAVLIGAGIAMVVSYLNARDRARRASPKAEERVGEAEVRALPPEPVPSSAARVRHELAGPAVPASSKSARARERSPRSRRGAPRRTPKGPPTAGTAAAPAAPAPLPEPGPGDQPHAADGGVAGPATAPEPKNGDGPGEAASAPGGEAGDAGAGADEVPVEKQIELLGRRIAVVVDRHKAQLERCYRQAAKGSTPSEPLEGRVVIQFGIMPNGQAENARAVENTSGSDRLATCVAAEIQGWTFPTHSAAGALEFRWPFVFKAPK